MRYAVVIERGATNYSAYVPDLPGCISTGQTVAEVRQSLQEAIDLRVQGLRSDGEIIPPSTTLCDYIEL